MARGLSRRSFIGAAASGSVGIALARTARAQAQPTDALPSPESISVSDPALLSAVEAASLLQSGQLHPRELLDACLGRSRALDGDIGAWVRIYPEMAYSAAEAAGERLSERGRSTDGQPPLVCGLPIALKDIYAVAGLPLTASSRVLDGNIAAGNSGVWNRLEQTGMVLLGHAHTHEFAIGVTTPQVGNPWNTAFSPGGSSGGSAAVLAARFAPLATGSDTGGSLRIPASVCGVSSIKPTYGVCSTAGMIPLTWTRDHAGPMGRSLADASLLLRYMAGVDESDPTTRAAPSEAYPLAASGDAQPFAGRRFGVPETLFDDMPPAIATLMTTALDTARALGAEVVDVRMPAYPSSLLLGDRCEMGAYHQQFTDRLDKYSPASAIAVGIASAALVTPVADYIGFEHDRMRYQRDFNRMFADSGIDALFMPGTVSDGIERGPGGPLGVLENPMADVRWANYTGAPVATIPVGRSAETGLPFGIQIGGLPWTDADVIRVGLEMQDALGTWQDAPDIAPAPRDIPSFVRGEPGVGPDATGTLRASTPLGTLPTTATNPV